MRYFLLDDPVAAAAYYARDLAQPRLAAAPTRRLALISSLASIEARTGELAHAQQLVKQLGSQTFPQDSGMLAQPMLAYWSGDWDAALEEWSGVRERGCTSTKHCRLRSMRRLRRSK